MRGSGRVKANLLKKGGGIVHGTKGHRVLHTGVVYGSDGIAHSLESSAFRQPSQTAAVEFGTYHAPRSEPGSDRLTSSAHESLGTRTFALKGVTASVNLESWKKLVESRELGMECERR